MLRECFYHTSVSNWAYAYDKDTIHLRMRTKRDDVEEVIAVTGDKYDWERTKADYEMFKISSDSMFDYWEAHVKPRYKRLSYGFRLRSGDEYAWMIELGIYDEQPYPPGGYYDFPYIHENMHSAPDWAKEAIFYQIVPERFANGDTSNDPDNTEPWGGQPTYDNSFGGDLQGIIDHLDYLEDLGINAIYLTPVFESPSNHKYDTVDYKKVDPHFGDNALLKKLVKECHALGIRVMLDAVFNHCSDQFTPFQDVLKHGEYSIYADWFIIREYPLEVKDGVPTYDTFGFYGNMPKFNTSHPDVKKYLLRVAEYWIKEIKIDGWRLDVANEVDHEFWRDFRKIVKAANPEAYIVGEVWNDSLKWLMGDQFDSVMNYPFSKKVLQFFDDPYMDGSNFADSIGYLQMRYPQQTNEVIFNLLNSHDTPRVLTRMNGDKRKQKLCIVFLLTYIGTPCIYYGDEIGLTGGDDPECRKCMEWDMGRQDRELYDFYKLLIALRKNNKALRRGFFRFLKADPDDSRIIYERIDSDTHFTIWMNNTDQATWLSHPMETDDWKDALSGEDVLPVDGIMHIKLDVFGYRILHRKLNK